MIAIHRSHDFNQYLVSKLTSEVIQFNGKFDLIKDNTMHVVMRNISSQFLVS